MNNTKNLCIKVQGVGKESEGRLAAIAADINARLARSGDIFLRACVVQLLSADNAEPNETVSSPIEQSRSNVILVPEGGQWIDDGKSYRMGLGTTFAKLQEFFQDKPGSKPKDVQSVESILAGSVLCALICLSKEKIKGNQLDPDPDVLQKLTSAQSEIGHGSYAERRTTGMSELVRLSHLAALNRKIEAASAADLQVQVFNSEELSAIFALSVGYTLSLNQEQPGIDITESTAGWKASIKVKARLVNLVQKMQENKSKNIPSELSLQPTPKEVVTTRGSVSADQPKTVQPETNGNPAVVMPKPVPPASENEKVLEKTA